jgi:hypothetical protein
MQAGFIVTRCASEVVTGSDAICRSRYICLLRGLSFVRQGALWLWWGRFCSSYSFDMKRSILPVHNAVRRLEQLSSRQQLLHQQRHGFDK